MAAATPSPGPYSPDAGRLVTARSGWLAYAFVAAVTLAFGLHGSVTPTALAQESSTAEAKDPKKEEAKKEEAKEKEAEKKEGDKEPEDSIKRPSKPSIDPDPSELEATFDSDGRIQFRFRGQPWPQFLQWFADAAGYTLDWQELPKDFLNLTTDERHTVAEAHDLVNRLLLDRGYTMVLQGQVLSIMKLDKLEPSLLPRVEDESELMDLAAYDFVKITFELPDALQADKAVEDVKPLLSPHAKVQALMATNRLLVIDAVANLRAVSRLVNAEHAAAVSHAVPREFEIQHARADRVADQVMILLGLDPASRRTPQELQVEQQRLQLFTQMQQKGKDVAQYLRKDDIQVHIAVNHRRNSILVNAPPQEMKVIERSIKQLDASRAFASRAGSGSRGEVSDGPRMDKYQLVTLSPESIVSALEDIGDLDPRSRLTIDADARTIFAFATPLDHAKIQAMIDSLDGTGREFEVIWLRKLPADAVAATIHNLMVGKEEEEDNNRRPYYYYSYYGRNNAEQKKPNEGFRVDADVERNRLLLWANEAELKEVRKFLVKLDEIPGQGGNPNTVRFLEARDPGATRRLLDQIRQAWPTVGPNQLRIDNRQESDAAEDDDQDEAPADGSSVTRQANRGAVTTRLVQIEGAGAGPASGAGAGAGQAADPGTRDSGRPPVTITVTEDGRIVLRSDDVEALDRLEDLLAQFAPPPQDFKVFYLQNALASMVTLNLEEYFQEADDFDTEDNWLRAWYGYGFQSSDEGDGGSLNRRRKIRFIYDPDTNTILVSNASPSQLATVETLIEIYDRAPSEDSIAARRFRIFELRYAKAAPVAATIKEVYRDLLSTKDKEFANSNSKGDEKQSSQTTNYYRVYGSSNNDDKKSTKVKASFAGALSVGINEVANTVIVSAQEEWIESIAEMIQYLDDSAQSMIVVHQASGRVSPATLNAALAVLGQPQTPPTEPTEQEGEQAGAKDGSEGASENGEK